jgi:hypothetical protein
MIGQTFTLTGRPKLVFRLVWCGSIGGVDCVRGVTLNGKFRTLTRLSEPGRLGRVILCSPAPLCERRRLSRAAASHEREAPRERPPVAGHAGGRRPLAIDRQGRLANVGSSK